MAININNSGLMKSRSQSVGWLSAGPANTDLSSVTDATAELPAAIKDIGSIEIDSIVFAENFEEGEVFLDQNGNVIDSADGTSKPTISFKMPEILSEIASKMVYDDAIVTDNGEGVITEIDGSEAPSNKCIIMNTRIKGKNYRLILANCSFASRGDQTFGSGAPAVYEVVYNVLTPTVGKSRRILVSDPA